MEAHFLRVGEAAEFLNLSKSTLNTLRVKGGGPRYFKLGPGQTSSIRYLRENLLEWAKARTFESTSAVAIGKRMFKEGRGK